MKRSKGKHSKSSKQWLREHFKDPFVIQAQKEGWRSRAVYKLQEFQEKDRIFKPGLTVIDLGSAPGAWSQFARSQMGERGLIFAVDILPIDALPNVEFIQGDFTERTVYDALLALLATHEVDNKGIDLVLSDMAPNFSGIPEVDIPRAMYLVKIAVEFAYEHLKPGGDLVIKLFQGVGFDKIVTELRANFNHVRIRKPKASRGRSREVYLLAKGYVSKAMT